MGMKTRKKPVEKPKSKSWKPSPLAVALIDNGLRFLIGMTMVAEYRQIQKDAAKARRDGVWPERPITGAFPSLPPFDDTK